MVTRVTKDKQEILKVFQDDEAIEIYKLLTEVKRRLIFS
jgi:hypothetical protein